MYGFLNLKINIYSFLTNNRNLIYNFLLPTGPMHFILFFLEPNSSKVKNENEQKQMNL